MGKFRFYGTVLSREYQTEQKLFLKNSSLSYKHLAFTSVKQVQKAMEELI